jgi:hypothetical protein
VRLVLNSTAKEANVLCPQARASLARLAAARADSRWRLTVATALLSREGQAASFNLDARTGTATAAALLQGLDAVSVERYLCFLEKAVFAGTEAHSKVHTHTRRRLCSCCCCGVFRRDEMLP